MDKVAYNRQTLLFTPPRHPERSYSLITLAGSLFAYYRQAGKSEALEEAVNLEREAASLALRPTGHQGRSVAMGNLAKSLSYLSTRKQAEY